MRGPLLSGALGSSATLGRLCNLVQGHTPVVVLSALWLAETLSSEIPVLALVEKEKRSAARRAYRRSSKLGHPLAIVAAASEVPLAKNSVGAILVDSLVDIEEEAAACELLTALLPSLKPDGIVISLDATKSPTLEARVAGIFLGASLARLSQIRPREGALITMGNAPHPAITEARMRSLALNTG
jgi:hypothetical protein